MDNENGIEYIKIGFVGVLEAWQRLVMDYFQTS